MKKISLIILIVVMLEMMFILSGCIVTNNTSVAKNNSGCTFETVDFYTGIPVDGKIVKDSATNVIYFYSNNKTLTLLVDSEGKPLLYEGE